MKIIVLFFLFLCVQSVAFGQARDMRIVDNDGHVADITSAGKLATSSTNDGHVNQSSNVQDIRISDNDGNVADITAAGVLKVS